MKFHKTNDRIKYLPFRYRLLRFPFTRKYELLNLIRSSYKTDVFKAYDYKRKQFIALKLIYFDSPALILNDSQFMERWNRMCRYGKKLRHPNVLSIIDHGIDIRKGVFFYTTIYISGHSLDDPDFLKSLSYRRKLEIAIDLANALASAHNRGIIHRDIKPDNILIDQNGVGYLTDFESAKYTSNPITAPGMTLGTPAYMSPEQIKGERLDTLSDIYSLGNIYYYLFTEKFPFEGENSIDISHKIVHKEPVPPNEINKSIPTNISDLIIKMLIKDQKSRINSMRVITDELKKILEKK